MKQKGYLAVYAAVGTALLIALIAAPGVWATPGQSAHAQTVPTRTPVPPPIEVTDPPPAPVTPQPGATALPTVAATVAPGATVAPRITVTAVAPRTGRVAGPAPLELPATGGCIRP